MPTVAASVEHPKNATEALTRLDRWLWRLAAKWARRLRVTSQEFHHELTIRVFLAFPSWNPRKGSLTGWAAWQARATASRLRREQQGPHRFKVASQSEQLSTRLENTANRLRVETEDEWEEVDPAISAAVLRSKVAALRPREALAMWLRFGLDGKARTLREVGEEMGVTKERIRQLVGKGLRRLRDQLGPGMVRFPADGSNP